MTLISKTDVSVPVTVQARADLTPARAFEVIVPIDSSPVFTSWGPFPGVRSATNQTGARDHVGASLNPDLSGGSTATETAHRELPLRKRWRSSPHQSELLSHAQTRW